MSLPRTIPEPTVPQEPTRAHQGDGPAPPRPPAQFRVALVPHAAAQPTSELAEQLRKRLRFCAVLIAVLAAAVFGLRLPFKFPRLVAAPLEAITQDPQYWVFLVMAGLQGTLAARLSPRLPAHLARLRLVEWLVFAPPVILNVWMENANLVASLPELAKDPGRFALASSTPWALALIGYGVLIPNTWRRCASAVGLIALSGYLPSVFVVLVHPG